MPRLTAEEERKILQNIWGLENTDEQVFELLANTEKRKKRLRAKLVEDLADIQPDQISDRERLKEALLTALKHDEDIVKRKAAITCAFLGVSEAVTIILEQLPGASHDTATSFLRALSVFQDESSRDDIIAYAIGLIDERDDESEWYTRRLLGYISELLGFLVITKARQAKMDVQEIWYCLQ